MAFDEDAADGFRPPPHPDDRLWRHPSELKGVGDAGAQRNIPLGDDLPAPTAARPPDWMGVAGHMALVGGVGVVALALALAVLGIPQRVSDGPQETALSPAATVTTAGPENSSPSLWNRPEPTPEAADPEPAPGTTDPADALTLEDGDASPDGPPATPAPPADAEQVETEAPRTWLGVDGRAMPGIAFDTDADTGPDPATGADRDSNGNGHANGPGAWSDENPRSGPLQSHFEGVLVTNVVEASPASPHLSPGDVILSVDGRPTPDMDTLLGVLADRSPGDEVDVVHRRLWHHTPLTSTLTLAERPQ